MPPLLPALLLPFALASRVRDQAAGAVAGQLLRGRYELLALLHGGDEPPEDTGFVMSERLGGGGFGEAWRAQDRQRGIEVVVKLFYGPGGRYAAKVDDEIAEGAERECGVAQEMLAGSSSYPAGRAHICGCLEAHVRGPGPLFIVLESCGESLLKKMEQRRKEGGPVALEDTRRWMRGVLMALSFMNGLERPMVHGDLSTRNLAITEGGEAKLIDFGLARKFPLAAWHPWREDVYNWARMYGFLLCGHASIAPARKRGEYCRDGTMGTGSEEDWRRVDLGLEKSTTPPAELMGLWDSP